QAHSAPCPQSPPSQQDLRKMISGQLAQALLVNVGELSGQAAPTEFLEPHDVAKAVESELYKQFGGVGKEYMRRFRSLHFNLADSNNPDLRAQVLMGKIAPDVLVRMGPNELTSSELNKWRSQKAQECLKSALLDGETAAGFATAAVMKWRQLANGHSSQPTMPVLGSDLQVALQHQHTASSRPDVHTSDLVEEMHTRNSLRCVPIEENFTSETGLDNCQVSVPPSPPLTPWHAEDANMNESTGSPGGEAHVVDPFHPAAIPSVIAHLPRSPSVTAGPEDQSLPDWAIGEWEGNDKAVPSTTANRTVFGGTDNTVADSSGVAEGPALADEMEYSPTLPRTASTYSPNRPSNAPIDMPSAIEGLAPLVQMPAKLGTLVPVGTHVWQGRFTGLVDVSFKMKCEALAGIADLSKMLATEEMEIKGRVDSDKVETFFEQLRGSKNRTATLGLLKLADDAGLMDQACVNELIKHYSRRGRSGVIAPGPDLEGYLVAKSDLAARLLLTASAVVDSGQRAEVPVNVSPSGELLLVIIHKKSWMHPSMNSVIRGNEGIKGVDGVAESVPVSSQAQQQSSNIREWSDASRNVIGKSDTSFAQTSTQQVRQPVDPRRPQRQQLPEDSKFGQNNGQQPSFSGLIPDGIALQPSVKGSNRDQGQSSQESCTRTQLPEGLNMKGINELAALFGIPTATSVPPPAVPSQLHLIAKQKPMGPAKTANMPMAGPAGCVTKTPLPQQVASEAVGPGSTHAVGGPHHMGDVPAELHRRTGGLMAPPPAAACAQLLGPSGLHGLPLQSPVIGTGRLGDGLQGLNSNGTPGRGLGSVLCATPGASPGEGKLHMKRKVMGQLAAGWKDTPEGGNLSIPAASQSPAGLPLTQCAPPQIMQMSGPRPSFVVIQDRSRVLQKATTPARALPISSYPPPTHLDSQGRHPRMHGLNGVRASWTLQSKAPAFMHNSRGHPSDGDKQHVVVNSKGVSIVVKPKRPGRAQGREGCRSLHAAKANRDIERHHYLPLSGTPSVGASPFGRMGPMKGALPSGPYQRVVEAQVLPAGNVIEPSLGSIQRPTVNQSRIQLPGRGCGRRGRSYASGIRQHRSKRRYPST
ncbi:unnamed protein product, partial [Ostreobium quekettii]